MEYRADLERFHGRINDPIKCAQQDYDEIVEVYGTPMLVLNDKKWPSSFVGCVYQEGVTKNIATYRVRYSYYDYDSFTIELPRWYGGERLEYALIYQTVEESFYDEPDDSWVRFLENLVALDGEVSFEEVYAA